MVKSNKKNWIVRIGLIVLILLAFSGKYFYTLIDSQDNTSSHSLESYNNLFDDDAKAKLKILTTVESRHRQPESVYIYDNKFHVLVLRLSLSKDVLLRDIIDYQQTDPEFDQRIAHLLLPSFNFKLHKKSGRTPTVSAVHLKIKGDGFAKTDDRGSLLSYYYNFNSFSINYNNEPDDIFAQATADNVGACLSFIKKDKFLYILLLTSANGDAKVQPNTLNSIINKRL